MLNRRSRIRRGGGLHFAVMLFNFGGGSDGIVSSIAIRIGGRVDGGSIRFGLSTVVCGLGLGGGRRVCGGGLGLLGHECGSGQK